MWFLSSFTYNYMAFVRKQGKTKLMWLPVTTSTAFTKDALVVWASGLLIPATSTTTAKAAVGVIRHAIASTDADYATARLVEVEVPVENFVIWTADGTGTFVATDCGGYFDLSDSVTANKGATTYGLCYMTKFISATKIECVLNVGPAGVGTSS